MHITGGGFYENIPRILPEGIAADIDAGTWDMPAVFDYIQKCGRYREKRDVLNLQHGNRHDDGGRGKGR